MATMIKEDRYVVYIGSEEYVLRVQELLWGLDPWPERFRVLLPASNEWTATTMYGSTAREAAERTMEYLHCFIGARTRMAHAKAS